MGSMGWVGDLAYFWVTCFECGKVRSRSGVWREETPEEFVWFGAELVEIWQAESWQGGHIRAGRVILLYLCQDLMESFGVNYGCIGTFGAFHLQPYAWNLVKYLQRSKMMFWVDLGDFGNDRVARFAWAKLWLDSSLRGMEIIEKFVWFAWESVEIWQGECWQGTHVGAGESYLAVSLFRDYRFLFGKM
jgi:hypothetical protein